MNKKELLCLSTFVLLLIGGLNAKVVTDTLYSTKNDRVILTYELSQNNGRTTIKFSDVRKKLGRSFSSKYKDLSDVAVVFFDRYGNFEDVRFTGLNVEAFMVPSNMEYQRSADGYFLLKDKKDNDNPSIVLDIKNNEPSVLSIPLYLANYEKKGRYTVFSSCGNLNVKIAKNRGRNDSNSSQTVTETVTSNEELESGMSSIDEAQIRINAITGLLAEQDKLPFTEELSHEVSMLRELRYKITDNDVSSRINETLAAVDSKRRQLEEQAEIDTKNAQEEAEQKAKQAEKEAMARQDSIAAVQQQKADEDKKRNMWLMIGGVILAILGFIGNQAFQHFRNMKNQKSMMEMQQSVVKRAETEAKRRAQSMVRSKISQVKNEARTKSRNIVNDNIKNIGKVKKNKGVSI